jgi:uncharacterized membrane protein
MDNRTHDHSVRRAPDLLLPSAIPPAAIWVLICLALAYLFRPGHVEASRQLAVIAAIVIAGIVPLVIGVLYRQTPRRGWTALMIALIVVTFLLTNFDGLAFA